MIEDESQILEFVSRVLEFEGYRVFRAMEGEVGLKIIEEVSVDLVILDLQLPSCDGFTILRQMRRQP